MATTQDKVKIVRTTNISTKDAATYGEEAVIFDTSGGVYLGNKTTSANKIAVSPNDLSTGLATKLDKSGGTISNSWSSPFVLNNTSTTGEIGMKLTLADVDKGWVGYNDNYGTYLYTKTGPHKLGIKTDGNGYIDDNTILHGGNYHNYVNKLRINGIDSSVTHGSYAGIIQAHDVDNNPTDGWYNRFKILHGNTNGYYTELAMPFTNSNLYYRIMSNGTLFDWRRIPFIDDVLPSTGGSISGALTLTGTTYDTAAIEFSRVGYNYITIPEGNSRLAFTVRSDDGTHTKMVILSSGNVGIGTDAPTEKLEVIGNAKATKFIGALQGNADTATKLANTRKLWGQNFDGTADVNGNLILYNADDLDNDNASSSKLVFGGSAAYRGPYIEGVAGGGWGMKNLVFYQYNTQEWPGDYSKHYAAMTLDINGKLGIGRTPTTEKLEVEGNIKVTGKLFAGSYILSTISGGDNTIQCDNGNAIADMRVTSAGSVKLMRWKDSVGSSIIESDGTNTILRTGNVGIGTTSPTEKLEVSGNVKATKFIGALQGNADSASKSYGLKTFLPSNADANHNTFYIGGQYAVSTTEEEGKAFVGSSGNKNVLSVPELDGSSTLANVMNLRMSFNAQYWHDIATGPNREDLWHRRVTNGTAFDWSTILDSTNYTSYVVPKTGGTFTGNVSAPDFITTSDARLKDFVDDITIDFDALKSIPKKTYYWKDKEQYGDQLEIGTSAQELMKVYPECVSYDDESDKYSVNYQKLSIIALAAIDKLHDENAELKSRLDKIEKLLNI